MPKNTAAGIYISAFGTLACFAFVWDIVWLIVVSVIGIIVTFVVRGFDENPEYTITASEVQKLEEARIKKDSTVVSSRDGDTDEDMGLWELVRVVAGFFLDVIRNKRWRTR